jgi:hypothetical protein
MSTKQPDNDLHYGTWDSAELATLETGRQARDAFNKTIYRWFEIGEAIEIVRQKAERLNDRFAFKRIMRKEGFSMEKEDKVIDKAMVTKLKQVCDRKTEVIAWHETLTPKQKREWAAPNTVIKHFFTRDAQDQRINWNGQRIDPKGNLLDDNGQVAEKPPTKAEEQAAAIVELEEELTAARAHITELEAAREVGTQTPDEMADALIVLINGFSPDAKAVPWFIRLCEAIHNLNKPSEKPKAKKAKGAKAKPRNGALVWEDKCKPHHECYEAPAVKGIYRIGAGFIIAIGGDGMGDCYHIDHIANPDANLDDQVRRPLGSYKTVVEARAVAQRDYDKLRKQA